MNLTEKELLTRFLQQLASAQAGQKDAEAEALIREVATKQPDAAYLLVQRTIQLEHLLAASQSEVQKLQAQSAQAKPQSDSGFLGDPNAWGRSPAPAARSAPSVAQATGMAPRTGAPAPMSPMSPMARQAAPASSWGSGLFGNIAATAAGVVAGGFLYQGIQNLMNRNDSQSQTHQTPPHDADAERVAQSNEPELLNSYDTPADGSGDTFAWGDDESGGGDIA